MNKGWLLKTADAPIRCILSRGEEDAGRLLENVEVAAWLSRLQGRSAANDIGDVHGSHDYRMENILGKCWILGLRKDTPSFSENMAFVVQFLVSHIQTRPPDRPGFGRLYHFRDYEKVLACFLPFLGYHADPAVLHVAHVRIEVLLSFARQMRYDIYVDGAQLKGVKKEWQRYIINPDLYADGHIALPDIHDFLMFAGLYPFLTADDQDKIETIVAWLFGSGYSGVVRRYGYFYVPDRSYNTKAVIFKLDLPDVWAASLEKGDLVPLLFNVFVLSHFKTARTSVWFSAALDYLRQYKSAAGRYRFPAHMITEKPDAYVIFGGHMNVGEDKKLKSYSEVLSTYWMERIDQNMTVGEGEK